jgi:hypothetical protein
MLTSEIRFLLENALPIGTIVEYNARIDRREIELGRISEVRITTRGWIHDEPKKQDGQLRIEYAIDSPHSFSVVLPDTGVWLPTGKERGAR